MSSHWLNQLEDMAAWLNEHGDRAGPGWRAALGTLMDEHHAVARGLVSEERSRAAMRAFVGAAR
ncbi:MAG: hypothetical protein ACRD03_01835 [Acidimicrobiales bacterium]